MDINNGAKFPVLHAVKEAIKFNKTSRVNVLLLESVTSSQGLTMTAHYLVFPLLLLPSLTLAISIEVTSFYHSYSNTMFGGRDSCVSQPDIANVTAIIGEKNTLEPLQASASILVSQCWTNFCSKI